MKKVIISLSLFFSLVLSFSFTAFASSYNSITFSTDDLSVYMLPEDGTWVEYDFVVTQDGFYGMSIPTGEFRYHVNLNDRSFAVSAGDTLTLHLDMWGQTAGAFDNVLVEFSSADGTRLLLDGDSSVLGGFSLPGTDFTYSGFWVDSFGAELRNWGVTGNYSAVVSATNAQSFVVTSIKFVFFYSSISTTRYGSIAPDDNMFTISYGDIRSPDYPNYSPPDDTGILDMNSKEDALLSGTEAGLNDFNSSVLGLGDALASSVRGMTYVQRVMNDLFTYLPSINVVVQISLACGMIAFLLGLASTIVRRIQSKGGGK